MISISVPKYKQQSYSYDDANVHQQQQILPWTVAEFKQSSQIHMKQLTR